MFTSGPPTNAANAPVLNGLGQIVAELKMYAGAAVVGGLLFATGAAIYAAVDRTSLFSNAVGPVPLPAAIEPASPAFQPAPAPPPLLAPPLTQGGMFTSGIVDPSNEVRGSSIYTASGGLFGHVEEIIVSKSGEPEAVRVAPPPVGSSKTPRPASVVVPYRSVHWVQRGGSATTFSSDVYGIVGLASPANSPPALGMNNSGRLPARTN